MQYNPAYITKNRLGIYYFQYCFPKSLLPSNCSKKRVFRKTLRTRDKREAKQKAIYFLMTIEKLRKQFFSNSDMFAQAMKLLMEYDQVLEIESWDTAEHFLTRLDDYQSNLLNGAISYKQNEENLVNADSNSKDIRIKHLEEMLARAGNQNSVQFSNDENPLLTEAMSKYLNLKLPALRKSSATSISGFLSIFQKIIFEKYPTDLRVSDLDVHVVGYFKDVLKSLPRNRNSKELKDKSFLEMSKTSGVKLSPKSIQNYMISIGEFLKWAESLGYAIPTKSRVALLYEVNKKIKASSERGAFTDEELTKLFTLRDFTAGQIRASDYWVPLIALFTGARMAEICQLALNDIKNDNGIWVFDINAKGDNQLKTHGSARSVPIHNSLLDLGLIKYSEFMRREGNNLLFPLEERNPDGKFDAFSKRFRRTIFKAGILSVDERTMVFHSFRHTLRTRLSDLSIPEGLIDDIVGHTSSLRSIGKSSYTHTQLINQKSEALAKLKFTNCLKAIKPWHLCQFAKK